MNIRLLAVILITFVLAQPFSRAQDLSRTLGGEPVAGTEAENAGTPNSEDSVTDTDGSTATQQKDTGDGAKDDAKKGDPQKDQGKQANNPPAHEYYGVYAPGKGFVLAHTDYGDVNFSLYFQARYLNQIPPGPVDQRFYIDHLGRQQPLSPEPRNDIQVNRMLIMFTGWLYDPKFHYFVYTWTSNSNLGNQNQILVGGNVSYDFSKAFQLFLGIGPMPGDRTNQNVWPYFLGQDRRMADEWIRPAYTQGIWVAGHPLPKFYYQVMMGNNLSLLGINAGQLDRRYSFSAGAWVFPTTGEYGPRAAYSDFEIHDKVATRIGGGFTFSPETRQEQGTPLSAGENTVLRLSDGVVIFDDGALAPGVIVEQVNYKLASISADMKYKGFALSGEYFARWLNNFRATGPLPLERIFDQAFQVQTSYEVWRKHIEVYGANSTVIGQFNNAWEVAGGINWFPFKNRSVRGQAELMHVVKCPTGSLYTPYLVGQTGQIFYSNLEIFF